MSCPDLLRNLPEIGNLYLAFECRPRQNGDWLNGSVVARVTSLPPPVLFLPGFMCDSRLFAPQVEALRGHGIEAYHGDLCGAASVTRLARQVLAQAPPHFALVGLSMGGIIAFEILRRAPGRVTHLALLNTTPRADANGPARKRQLARIARGEVADVMREDLKPQYLAAPNRTPENLALIMAMAERLGEEVFARQTLALMNRPDSEALLSEIGCPTLVLAGAEDTVCPPALHESMAREIPGATLRVLERCGHLSTLEQPARVTALIAGLVNANLPAGETRPRLKLVRGHD